MRLVRLSRGLFAKVDDDDYGRVIMKKWSVRPAPRTKNALYCVTNFKDADGKWRQIEMQRFIMRPPPDKVVIFMDYNGLNCQRSNLRVVDTKTAARHRRVRKDCATGLKGVFEDPKTGRYGARIVVNGVPEVLGLFDTKLEAAKVYDTSVRSAYGDVAPVHFPRVGESSARITPVEVPPPDRPRLKDKLTELLLM